MKNKIGVITCSNAALDYLDYPKDISIFRSVIMFNENELYDDFVDIDAKHFYERIDQEKVVPKTSYVAIGKMIDIFEDYKAKGYDELLVVTISSNLSGLYEAVKNASKQVDIKVTVFDSRTLAYAEAYMVLKAHEMAENGHSMDEIISELKRIRDNNKLFFAVETLLFLIKNGRLSKFAGAVANMLKIKPLLSINEEGRVVSIEKIRTFQKAVSSVLEMYYKATANKDVITYISHAHNETVAKYCKEEIEKRFPDREVIVAYLTPVVGAHTGPRAIGIGFIEK
ncbi:DegV family protein [Acholeplasma sp. OttesenSCG-928-E16]|nr:DegV family protein [Acholeplasma sp. OttesenSCG-928-E16]